MNMWVLMQKLLIFIIAAFFISTCFADNYPVIWTDQVKLNSLADIPKILSTQKITEVQYSNDNTGQTAVAKTCEDYFKLRKAGFFPVNNMEIGQESYFKNTCDPLQYFQHAQPATMSYIRNFNLQTDYKLLPAAAIFPSLGNMPDPEGNLGTAFPDIQISGTPSKNSITVTSQNIGMEADISVLGWGDFTHSGNDQMLIFVANYALGGTYHSYTTYVLGKDSASAPIINVGN